MHGEDDGGGFQVKSGQRVRLPRRAEERQGGGARRILYGAWTKQKSGLVLLSCLGRGAVSSQVEEELVGGEMFLRAMAARGKSLGQHRIDVQFAAKEISRFTSKPEEQDRRSAKISARRLKDIERMVIEYHFQRMR